MLHTSPSLASLAVPLPVGGEITLFWKERRVVPFRGRIASLRSTRPFSDICGRNFRQRQSPCRKIFFSSGIILASYKFYLKYRFGKRIDLNAVSVGIRYRS